MMACPVLKVLIPEVLEKAFSIVVGLFEECGLTVENPGNSRITTWSNSGDQEEVAKGSLFSEVVNEHITNVQFWSSPGDDVFVSWKQDSSGCIFSFYLKGVDRAVAAELVLKFAEVVLVEYKLKYGDGDALAITFE
ncbi:hypothetical protein RAS12_02240 [Achromobacter seleniivolatilans]|uniref:Uncharacterized protein n=1 Tax=Achromobacter seleniivolatilans TaxID=3047478 RepID=A0ABY9M2I8_9BURK|nr:hypothetical protein [Achromobacter sp. R39]WMD21209.1 hypothetical protein RAS12_02240 [Achromobacter sp. R39]